MGVLSSHSLHFSHVVQYLFEIGASSFVLAGEVGVYCTLTMADEGGSGLKPWIIPLVIIIVMVLLLGRPSALL